MINIRKLFLLIAFLSITVLAEAVDSDVPSLKTTLSRKRIFVGDRIRYKTEITSQYNLEIEFPQFKSGKLGDCEIKDSGSSVKRRLFGGRTTYANWLDLTSYYVGKRKVPSIEIKYKEIGEGNWKTLKTEEQSFTVETVLPRGVKLQDIKDIKGPVYPFSFLKLFIWLAAAAVILWILLKIIQKLRKKAPPKLPYQIALEELDAAKEQFSLTGDPKEYYVRISDAVRRYIEGAFSLRAPEMTTQEFLFSLGSSPKLSGAHKDLLKVFMEACDLVKFAKKAPAREEIDSVFTTAKKFIEETKGVYADI